MEKTFSVYIHENLLNGKKYIGITSLVPEARWRDGRGYKNQIFGRAIEKYGWDNFSHTIVAENLSEKEAKNLEIKLISKFKTTDKKHGYNISEGGDTTSPKLYHHVYQYDINGRLINEYPSHCAAAKSTGIREDMIGKTCKGSRFTTGGFVWSDIPLSSERVKDIFKAKEEKIKQARLKGSMATKKSLGMKIQQLDKEGNLIKEFSSQSEASKFTGIDQSQISKVVRGKGKTAGGYRWRAV